MIELNELQSMMFAMLMVPMITSTVTSITSFIKYLAVLIFDYVTEMFDKSCTVIIQQKNISGKNGIGRDHETRSELLIEAITMFIDTKTSRKSRCVVVRPDSGGMPHLEYMRSHRLVRLPKDQIVHGNLTLKFKDSNELVKNIGIENKQSVIIKAPKMSDIDMFLNQCWDAYLIKTCTDSKHSAYVMQNEQEPTFKPYPFMSNVKFNDIYIDGKEKIIESIDQLLNKKRKKLSFLLHGLPGCGKTSFIKSMANYTKFNIIIIKLSLIQNDSDLNDIFNSPYIKNPDDERGSNTEYLERSKRIYVLEDIDAESSTVLTRDDDDDDIARNDTDEKLDMLLSIASKNKDSDSESENRNPIFMPKSKLTLAGILNSLDGIIELEGIVIMTTNHPEKLDSALVREGRVDFNLELTKISSSHAAEMVEKYFPGIKCKIADKIITPAKLEQICKTSTSDDILMKLSQL